MTGIVVRKIRREPSGDGKMSGTAHAGGRRCGAVRFHADAEPLPVGYCHCGDSRRATGAPVSAFVGFPAGAVSISGGSLRSFRNGAVTRSFRGVCGSPLTYADGVWFMPGAMEAPAVYGPTLHACASEQPPFLHMPDGLPRHQKSSVIRPDGTSR